MNYYYRNRESILEYQKAYNKANDTHVKEYFKEYYLLNKDTIHTRQKERLKPIRDANKAETLKKREEKALLKQQTKDNIRLQELQEEFEEHKVQLQETLKVEVIPFKDIKRTLTGFTLSFD